MADAAVKIRVMHDSGNQGVTWMTVAVDADEWDEMSEGEREEWANDAVYEFTKTTYELIS